MILILLINLVIGCTNEYKYDPGKDTVEIFGDGTYQIGNFNSGMRLINEEKDESIDYVKKYKIIKPLVYIIGSKRYILLNYEDKKIIQSKNIKVFSEKDAEIFKELEGSN